MEKGKCFVYSWSIDEDETEVTLMRMYAIGENDENVCIRISDFTPYIYIELPPYINWNSAKAQLVGNKLDEILGKKTAISKVLVYKKKLYGAHLEMGSTKRKLFPYLFCNFSNRNDMKNLFWRTRNNIMVAGLGSIKLKIHESDADPVLQFTCHRQIPTAGWIQFSGKRIEDAGKITNCDCEYQVKWKNVASFNLDKVARPKIMGFDIEVNSTNPSAMPNANKPGDKVFQISCVLSRGIDNYEKYLLTLGEPDAEVVGEDVEIYMYGTEADLLVGFRDFVQDQQPNVMVGYNILGFDIPYMIARAKENMCIMDFDKLGFNYMAHSKEKLIKWSSSAYKNQEFEYLDAEGRLYIDLLPLVRRDFKFNNYRLKTIAEYFIGESKDPLSAKGIFKCYRIGMKKSGDEYGNRARRAMGIVGKYCVQDSVLVVRLMDKLKTWVGLTEMASVCNVSAFALYTQGQQIKVYSQLYRYCMYENIVVEKDGYAGSESERFVGALVFPPIPGKYRMVVPFDFASLYPSTIIAYNICYFTWVPDESEIPDSMCHVMEWEDHLGCCHDPKVIRKMELNKYIDAEKAKIKKIREKRNSCADKYRKKEFMDEINKLTEELKPYTQERAELTQTIAKNVMCCKRRYRFLKEPRGVLPTVIQNCLDARKKTRKVDMKKIKEQLSQETDPAKILELQGLLDVLDKRQLAYKVSANSMYGAMGVRRGYLPFMPGAMCTTYMGRVNIEKVAKVIPEKFRGELIYGDTDSNYIHFPHLETAQETWDYALYVAGEVTKLFPKPIELEFEEEIYAFFFILSKKRYMYRKCYRDGVVDSKIGKKGVLLARRDNSKFVRDVYEKTIANIADGQSQDEIMSGILEELNLLCSNSKPTGEFVVTKSVGDIGDSSIETFSNEKGVLKGKMGDYTVTLLPDGSEWAKKIESKKISVPDVMTDSEVRELEMQYYLTCLPAQVQLAQRMKKRGTRVDAGTRLEYVVTGPDNHVGKLYEKIEHVEYFVRHAEVLRIDHMYYLKALINPLDQVLDVAFGRTMGLVMEQYNYRYKKRGKMIKELNDLFRSRISIIN